MYETTVKQFRRIGMRLSTLLGRKLDVIEWTQVKHISRKYHPQSIDFALKAFEKNQVGHKLYHVQELIILINRIDDGKFKLQPEEIKSKTEEITTFQDKGRQILTDITHGRSIDNTI